MDQASEAKFLASRKDFLTLDSTSLANRNQEIKFGNGRGNKFAANALMFSSFPTYTWFRFLIHFNLSFSFFVCHNHLYVCVCVL